MAKKNARQQKKAQQRFNSDSYQNAFLNIGNEGDRSAYSRIASGRILDQMTLNDLYLSDGLGRRIIDSVADEMFRAGFTIDGASNEPEVHSRWDELNLTQHFTDAIAWARLYGGSLILFGVNDGGDLTSPLGEGELDFVRVYDRHQVSQNTRDIDPASKTYGEINLYQVNPVAGQPYLVHASRCHVFDGERLPNQLRHQNQGWGASCLQGIYTALVDFGMSHKNASGLLERKQQAVWKYSGLTDACMADEGKDQIRERINLVDMTRSINNMVAIDAEEEAFELLSGDLTGVVDVVDRKKQLICGLTGIPESILFGTRNSALNGNDKEVPESWKQLIGRKQKDEARPAIEKAVSMLTRDKTWTINFNPLCLPGDKEQSETDHAQSQADEAYLAAGVISQYELRDTLRQRGRYVMANEDLSDEEESEGEKGLAISGIDRKRLSECSGQLY